MQPVSAVRRQRKHQDSHLTSTTEHGNVLLVQHMSIECKNFVVDAGVNNGYEVLQPSTKSSMLIHHFS